MHGAEHTQGDNAERRAGLLCEAELATLRPGARLPPCHCNRRSGFGSYYATCRDNLSSLPWKSYFPGY